jgi:hypothetical protein
MQISGMSVEMPPARPGFISPPPSIHCYPPDRSDMVLTIGECFTIRWRSPWRQCRLRAYQRANHLIGPNGAEYWEVYACRGRRMLKH